VSYLIEFGATVSRKFCLFNVHHISILDILIMYLYKIFVVSFFNIKKEVDAGLG